MSKPWKIIMTQLALRDLARFNKKQREQIDNMVKRFSENPLPRSEGGYGLPLSGELAGYFKIRLLDAGIRVVYGLKREKNRMIVVVIGLRRDNAVYITAAQRLRDFKNPK